jgi:phage/plasmid-like protein (TIGR03299 family)
MAHELEIRDGKASFFSVMQTAWHMLGELLTTPPKNTAEAVEMIRADFPVAVRPLSYTAYTDSGDTYPVESKLAASIVREDTGKEIGSASPDYQVMENRNAFRVLDPLIAEGLATIETGGVLRDGADAFLLIKWNLAKFGERTQAAFGSELLPFGLMTNSYSGRRGIGLLDTSVRVVCANTIAMAYGTKSPRVIVKHSKQAETRVIDAAHKLWGNVIAKYDNVAREYDALRAIVLTEAQFKAAVLDVIAPLPQEQKDFNPAGKFAAVVVQRAEDKRNTLTALWDNGLGHTGNRSGWEAVQGAIQALDHDSQFFNGRSVDAKAVALLDGPLALAKRQVYANVLELATAGK